MVFSGGYRSVLRVALVVEGRIDGIVGQWIVEKTLGTPASFELIAFRGVDGILKNGLLTTIKAARSCRADAVVCIVDSDNTPPHREDAQTHWLDALKTGAGFQPCDHNCRLCRLRLACLSEGDLTSYCRTDRWIKVALGLAVPEIEAWLLNDGSFISETLWSQLGYAERNSRRDRLKMRLYGNSKAVEARARVAVGRLSQVDLQHLCGSFPNGFGALINDLHHW